MSDEFIEDKETTVSWFSKGDNTGDEHWDYHASGAKLETKLAKIQRAVGANEAAKRSEQAAEAHRQELKGWFWT